MSYDLGLKDSITGDWLELDEPHQMKGGTYCVGGETRATLDVTYNYGRIFRRVFPEPRSDHAMADDGKLFGIRCLYGLTGAESVPLFKDAIGQLGDDVDADYWKPTEGNAKRALTQLLSLALLRPDGVWDGSADYCITNILHDYLVRVVFFRSHYGCKKSGMLLPSLCFMPYFRDFFLHSSYLFFI